MQKIKPIKLMMGSTVSSLILGTLTSYILPYPMTYHQVT